MPYNITLIKFKCQWFLTSGGTHLACGNLPCLTTQCLRIRYPSAHLLIKKQSTGLFFLTFAALIDFKSHHIYIKENPKTSLTVCFGILVRVMGLEPIRRGHTPLKRACLPIPAHSHICLSQERHIIISK